MNINSNTLYKIYNCFQMKRTEIRGQTKPELHYMYKIYKCNFKIYTLNWSKEMSHGQIL